MAVSFRPTEQFVASGHSIHEHVVSTMVAAALPFSIWVHRDAIVAKLDTEIECSGDDVTALSSKAQAARIAKLQAAHPHKSEYQPHAK